MPRAVSRRLCSAGVVLVFAVGGAAIAAEASGAAPGSPPAGDGGAAVQTRPVCGPVAGPRARCSALEVLNPDALVHSAKRPSRTTTTTAASATTTTTAATTTTTTASNSTTTTAPVNTTTSTTPSASCSSAHAGYTPCDLQSAYALPSTSAGGGQTVAIVDAYNDPNVESDLALYRSTYGLAPCTTANGCFRKVNQTGGTAYPSANTGWAEEISLDVDMVSAVCPNCRILLVEASSNSLGNLLTAENEAATLGANVISNSWGATEFSSETLYDSYFHHGIPITASTGDNGYGVSWPAASTYVTAVGGTSLLTASNTRGWSETAWSGAGSGCSAYEPKPTWQTDPGCARRTVGDVSAVADPNTGVAVYDTYNVGGWLVFGGTSVAAPIVASTYALATNGANITTPAYAYANAGALFDVTSGSNGNCGGSYLCTAVPGYDGPTGLGTPNGTNAL
jgi:subtilase family serine protease